MLSPIISIINLTDMETNNRIYFINIYIFNKYWFEHHMWKDLLSNFGFDVDRVTLDIALLLLHCCEWTMNRSRVNFEFIYEAHEFWTHLWKNVQRILTLFTFAHTYV